MFWQTILSFILSIGVGVAATLHVRVEQMSGPARVHAFRPVTLLLIAAIALLAPQPVATFYKGAILLGLYVSAAAGLLLMIPGTPLIVGVATSTVVYFLYFLAFASQNALRLPTPLIVPLIAFGALLFWSLAPNLRELKWSIVTYLVLTGLMGWQALEIYWQNGAPWTMLAALGAVLLMISDATLAFDQFRTPLTRRQLIVLSTYYSAHWFIAASVWGATVLPFG